MNADIQKIHAGERYEVGDPIRNLWSQVIRKALDDIERKLDHSDSIAERHRVWERNSAIYFFRDPHSRLPWICHMLGLDIDAVRGRAEELIKGEA